MSNKSTNTIKVSFSFAWLGVVFMALKLAGVIDWPWIWVTAPFWAGIAITFVMLLCMLLCMALVALLALVIAAVTK